MNSLRRHETPALKIESPREKDSNQRRDKNYAATYLGNAALSQNISDSIRSLKSLRCSQQNSEYIDAESLRNAPCNSVLERIGYDTYNRDEIVSEKIFCSSTEANLILDSSMNELDEFFLNRSTPPEKPDPFFEEGIGKKYDSPGNISIGTSIVEKATYPIDMSSLSLVSKFTRKHEKEENEDDMSHSSLPSSLNKNYKIKSPLGTESNASMARHKMYFYPDKNICNNDIGLCNVPLATGMSISAVNKARCQLNSLVQRQRYCKVATIRSSAKRFAPDSNFAKDFAVMNDISDGCATQVTEYSLSNVINPGMNALASCIWKQRDESGLTEETKTSSSNSEQLSSISRRRRRKICSNPPEKMFRSALIPIDLLASFGPIQNTEPQIHSLNTSSTIVKCRKPTPIFATNDRVQNKISFTSPTPMISRLPIEGELLSPHSAFKKCSNSTRKDTR